MSSFESSTSVPALSISDVGVIAPNELDVLAGALADITAAMGGNVNQDLSTPQGQIATSETAAIGNCYDAILAVANGVDPRLASGRMQDAIGHIYFMTRRGATATRVNAAITGAAGQTIAAGNLIASDGMYQYALINDVTIPFTGVASADLINTKKGALPCSAHSLTLHQYTPGIVEISNPAAGEMGSESEGRLAFEARRNDSVAANSSGQTASVLGNLLKVQGVTDAYAYSNGEGQAVTYNGVSVPAHSLYCCVAGGAPADIGLAIIQKKSPGCGTAGKTSVQVQDPAPVYQGNGPVYTVQYQTATPTPIFLVVTLKTGNDVPSTALDQLRAAIMKQFASGGTAASRPTIASQIFASQFGCVVSSLGSWARLISLQIGTSAPADQSYITMTMAQVPVMAAENISLILA